MASTIFFPLFPSATHPPRGIPVSCWAEPVITGALFTSSCHPNSQVRVTNTLRLCLSIQTDWASVKFSVESYLGFLSSLLYSARCDRSINDSPVLLWEIKEILFWNRRRPLISIIIDAPAPAFFRLPRNMRFRAMRVSKRSVESAKPLPDWSQIFPLLTKRDSLFYVVLITFTLFQAAVVSFILPCSCSSR